jgi:hypothetical protein
MVMDAGEISEAERDLRGLGPEESGWAVFFYRDVVPVTRVTLWCALWGGVFYRR